MWSDSLFSCIFHIFDKQFHLTHDTKPKYIRDYYFETAPDSKSLCLSKIVDMPHLREQLLRLSFQTARSLRISRDKYNVRIIPKWKKISPFFQNLFDVFVSHNRSVVEYEESSRAFVIERPTLQTKNGTWINDFPTVSFKLYNVIILHLSKTTIRERLQWRSFRETSVGAEAHIVWRYCLLGKVMRDGFRLKSGKNLELTVYNNISIESGAFSRNLSDVIQISVMEEDSRSVFLHNQVVDREMTLIRECGIPDVQSGMLIGCHLTTVADSKWSEVATGHDSAQTDWPFLWSKMTKREYRKNWETVHVCFYIFCVLYFFFYK